MSHPVTVGLQIVFAVLSAIGFFFAASNWCSEPVRLRIVSLSLGFLTLAFFLTIQW